MLQLKNLELQNFRSYKNLKLDYLEDTVIFLGDNASGKTNIIEAIYLACTFNSFRSCSIDDLINSNYDEHKSVTLIKTNMVGDGRSIELDIKFQPGKKEIFLNKKKKSASEINTILPAVVFTPEDLIIVKGGHKYRRQELDRLGCQLNSGYKQIVTDFNKLLHQKNHLLKNNAQKSIVYAINDVFSVVGERLLSLRKALFERMLPLVDAHFEKLSSGSFHLEQQYKASWEGSLKDKLNEFHLDEIQKGRTLVGPHLDEINYLIDGFDSTRRASQGQQRLLTLAIKLAQVDLIDQISGNPPILLLDDVMSELDEHKRYALFNLVNTNTQTFITTANAEYFPSSLINNTQTIKL